MKSDRVAKSLVLLAMIFVIASLTVNVSGKTVIIDKTATERPLMADYTFDSLKVSDRNTLLTYDPEINIDSSSVYERVTGKISSTQQGQSTTLLTGLEYPKGLWVEGNNIYLTETAGRNTVYGGKIALDLYDLSTGQMSVVVNNPVCSDAVAVASDGMIYLTSYVRVIPGESGTVSVVDPETKVESHLLDISIASEDMFIDSNDDIYIIGSSDSSQANSIYLLPSGDYTNPSILQTGLGRTWSISKTGDYVYYSDHYEIKRFDQTGSIETFLQKSPLSISFGPNYLYYADYFAGTVGRINMETKADETLVSGLNKPIQVRYDGASDKLYYLEAGTSDGQFKDGTLNVYTFTKKIAYILYDDATTANAYKTFLDANGYSTDLILNSSITSTVFDQYDLILVGTDTGRLSEWGTSSTVSALDNTGKPILGLGEGGYAFFGELSLAIGWGNGWHGSINSIAIVDSLHPVFNDPNVIGSGTVQLYSSTGHVGINLPSPPSDVVLLGREPSDANHYPLVQEKNRYMLWGFTGGPSSMTQTGKDLFINTVNFMSNVLVQVPHSPIYIDDNSDFARLGFPGTGTKTDPYRIEMYSITDSTTALIHVQDTDVYFVIRNNVLNGIDGSYNGIYLLNVTNASIEGNEIYNTASGITSIKSWNTFITSNDIYDNIGTGIFLGLSYNHTMSSNVIYSNSIGIGLNYTHDVGIIGNEIYDNSFGGIFVQNSEYITIEGNDIHDNGGSSGTLPPLSGASVAVGNIGYGIFLDPSGNNTIDGNWVYDNAVKGIHLQYSDSNKISGNEIYGNGEGGLFLENSDDNIISGNDITGNGFSTQPMLLSGASVAVGNIGYGIFLDPAIGNTIDDNYIYGNAANGIYLYESNDTDITNNDIYGNGEGGLFLEDSNYNTITGNDIAGNGFSTQPMLLSGASVAVGNIGYGIFLDPAIGNTIEDNFIYDNAANGIYLYESDDTDIVNNTIHSNGEGGLFLEDSNYNTITGNDIAGNGFSTQPAPFSGASVAVGNIGYGIFLDPAIGNTIDDNKIYSNAANGIYLYESDKTDITNNDIHSNGEGGLFLEDSNYNTIIGNDIAGNGFSTQPAPLSGASIAVGNIGYGIFLDPAIGNTIEDNYVYDNAANGIYLYESDETDITNNAVYGNGENGVFVEDSNDNTISGNDIYDNGFSTQPAPLSGASVAVGNIGYGIFLDPSDNNIITNNLIANNSLYGVTIADGSDNSVEWNDFIGNNEGGTSQAYDNGTDSSFQYNYWDDHDNTDTDGDGFADEPYYIDGPAGSQDSTPKSQPTPPGEHYLSTPVVLYPNGGEKVRGRVRVEWSAALDSLDHEVTYTLYYSKDAGNTWVEITSDLTDTSYKWDTSTVKPGRNYMVKVKATCSEGLTREDTSDGTFIIQKSATPGWTIGIMLLAIPALVTIRKYRRES